MELFEENKVSHLPVISDKNKYLGLIEDRAVFEYYTESKSVGENNHPFLRISIFPQTHIFEVIKTIGKYQLSLLPVINEQEQLLGYYKPQDIISALYKSTSFAEKGSILSLRMHRRDYSLHELTRLLEADGFLVTSVYYQEIDETDYLLVHLKLNKEEVSRALHTLERFNYEVAFTYSRNQYDDDLDDRLQSFLKFLNP
jgi:predicted transcriptional regulator